MSDVNAASDNLYTESESALESDEFEVVFVALQQVVDRLSEGGLSLQNSVRLYQLGHGLARRCETILREAEIQIEELEQTPSGAS